MGMGLSVSLRNWLTYTFSLKRQGKRTKDLWPSETLELTLVTSASQRKGAITASPRGSGGTTYMEQGDKKGIFMAKALGGVPVENMYPQHACWSQFLWS